MYTARRYAGWNLRRIRPGAIRGTRSRNAGRKLPTGSAAIRRRRSRWICRIWRCWWRQLSAHCTSVSTIKTLEQQLDTLKAENDALETSINTSVDLDHVYKVATEELGMVYAGKDQVLLYNQTESEYVKQYEDIPEQ